LIMVAASTRRSSAVIVIGAAAATWAACSTFVGGANPAARGALTSANGYRLDWMLEKKDGTDKLQTQDGYWLGEVGFEKSMGAQGLRYRMRASSQEIKAGEEVDGHIVSLGPIKIRLGEAFGGSGNNAKLRDLKRKMFQAGLTDPKKQEENKYWLARYGHKRWSEYYIDQSQGTGKTFLRGLAAWSGIDPQKEERGVTWFESDYGKPWLQKYVGRHIDGWVSAEQVAKEYETGKLNGNQEALPEPKVKVLGGELPPPTSAGGRLGERGIAPPTGRELLKE